MVRIANVAVAKCLFVVALIGHGVRAGIEDVLAGLSTPELNSLLEDLDGYNGESEGVDYNNFQGGNYDDYVGDYPEPEEEGDASAVKRSAQPDQTSGKSAAAAAMLPAYCDPPNPCPPGYTSAEGCIDDFENTSDFSRNFQAQQKCICDTEHMFNCPASGNDQAPPVQHKAGDAGIFLSEMPGLTADGRENPYFGGQKLPIAAKKGMDF